MPILTFKLLSSASGNGQEIASMTQKHDNLLRLQASEAAWQTRLRFKGPMLDGLRDVTAEINYYMGIIVIKSRTETTV